TPSTSKHPGKMAISRLRGDAWQPQQEASSRTLPRDDIASARAREPARECQAQAGAASQARLALDAGLEGALAEHRVEPGPVVAHAELQEAIGRREFEPDAAVAVSLRVLDQR